MSYTDKKNEWWRINNADAHINVKAEEIFRMFISKYPTTKVNGLRASFSSKDVDIFLRIRECTGSVNKRVLLRYSTTEDNMSAKTLQSCSGNSGEVREGHKYADCSSRINLDKAFHDIHNLIELKAKANDDTKKAKFVQQLEQMKLVGRIKMCLNDEMFKVRPCSFALERAEIVKQNDALVMRVSKYNEQFHVMIENIGSLFVKGEEFENFIKDTEGFLKYV